MVGKQAKLTLLLLLVVIISGFLYHPSWLWAGALLAVYVMHAVLWTDHIHYRPSDNYSWSFPSAERRNIEVSGRYLQIPQDLLEGYTLLLKVRVHGKLSGKIFDPYVDVTASGQAYKQYFERGCAAQRYINLTPAVEFLESESNEITLNSVHCDIDFQEAELIVFRNPELKNKRVLVIAPHADDAEIAAFGLYRNSDSMVVTLTAGEAEPETFRHYCEEEQEAALLKGRVRAWDSVAIPKWAGVKEDRVVHLGYFCKHLERMHENPDEPVTSEYAGVADTRVFREFNSLSLASDQHGTPSWKTLVADLTELIDLFKPDYIVSPHLTVDPHNDHHYSTLGSPAGASGSKAGKCTTSALCQPSPRH